MMRLQYQEQGFGDMEVNEIFLSAEEEMEDVDKAKNANNVDKEEDVNEEDAFDEEAA
jgi:hypothetical protein